MAPEHWATRLTADNPSLLRDLRTWIRRSLNEGVGAFVLAMFLMTAAVIALRVYVRDLAKLDAAMTEEVSRIVSTAQEPLDTVRQVGLVSAALAKLNEDKQEAAKAGADGAETARAGTGKAETRAGWICPEADSACQALNYLMEEVPNLMAQMDESPGVEPALPTPEQSCLAPDADEWTFLMMPRQLAPEAGTQVPARVIAAVRLSAALDVALKQAKDKFGIARTNRGMPSSSRLVQAYFISPDSVLRIWTRAEVKGNDCQAVFPQTRLWAAKAYFDDLWNSTTSYTRAYLDYGGHGLVTTYCNRLSVPGRERYGPGLEKLGALCADLKVDFADKRAALMDHLFFQTARISIPGGTVTDSTSIEVENGDADTIGAAWEATLVTSSDVRDAVYQKLETLKETGAVPATMPRDTAAVRARMQRDISTIRLGERNAFLLPLGGTDSASDYLLFIPRSPRLPWWERAAGVLGLLLGGAACASAVYGRLLARSATQSRNRLDLLRNLQVGVVQVDRKDRILSANDHAEEIFGRRLPKFADRQTGPSVNFARLIEPRVWRIPGDGRDLVASSLEQENEARSAGEFSAYFARLRGSEPARWIRVSATPMLLAHSGSAGVDSARVATVFASVDEVSDVTRLDLERRGLP